MKNIVITLILGLFACYISAQSETINKSTSPEVTSKLSGTAFVTKNLEASLKFYIDILGYKELGRKKLDDARSLSNFGIKEGNSVLYVSLVPDAFSDENRNFSTLNFVEINNAETNVLNQDAKRKPIQAETMTAYVVTGLKAIEKKIKKAGIPIIAPLALSGTGRSRTLSVLDPNGVRVQMYEYVTNSKE